MHHINFFRLLIHIWVQHWLFFRIKPTFPHMIETKCWHGPCRIQAWECECGKLFYTMED